MTNTVPVRVGQILTGPLFSEPMRVETARPNGPDSWVLGLVGPGADRAAVTGAIQRQATRR